MGSFSELPANRGSHLIEAVRWPVTDSDNHDLRERIDRLLAKTRAAIADSLKSLGEVRDRTRQQREQIASDRENRQRADAWNTDDA
jgi:hypothetical protein